MSAHPELSTLGTPRHFFLDILKNLDDGQKRKEIIARCCITNRAKHVLENTKYKHSGSLRCMLSYKCLKSS